MSIDKIIQIVTPYLLCLFLITRMWVTMKAYYDMEYNPISTYLNLLIVFLGCLVLFFRFRRAIQGSFLTILVLLYWGICIINMMVSKNIFESDLKLFLYVSLWEMVYVLFFFITKVNVELCNLRKIMILTSIPIIIIFLLSNGLHSQSTNIKWYSMGNNSIFYVLTLLPWLLTINNRKICLCAVVIVSTLCFISMKRSVIIVLVLFLPAYFYLEYIKNKSVNSLKVFVVGYILISCVFIYVLLRPTLNTSEKKNVIDRFEHIEEDHGSGRLDRYENVLRLFNQNMEQPLALWIGHGYRMVEIDLVSLVGEFYAGSAHNDFLEVIYDFGILGFLIYLFIHIYLIRRLIFLLRIDSVYKIAYLASYSIFIVMSMVSHLIIYPTYFISLVSFWAIIEALICNGFIIKNTKYETLY